MKFKVTLKPFQKFINKFLLKGNFTVNGSDEPNIRECNIYATGGEDGVITLVGADIPGSVFERGTIGAAVVEEGNDFIGNLVDFAKILKDMSGVEVTITFTETSMVIDDGKTKYTDELTQRTNVDDYDAFNTMAKYDVDYETIYVEDSPGTDNPGYLYTRWFNTSDCKTLSSLHDISIKRLGTDKIIVAQDDSKIKIDVESEHRNKSVQILLPIEWCEDASIHEVKNVLPIFRCLEGNASFYFYVTATGGKRYWILDNTESYNIEWMIRND